MKMAYSADRAEWFPAWHSQRLERKRRQQFAALLDYLLAIPIGEESEVANLDESAGQHMQEEAPDELDGLQGHLLDLIAVLRIAPAKVHPRHCPRQ